MIHWRLPEQMTDEELIRAFQDCTEEPEARWPTLLAAEMEKRNLDL